MADSSNRVHVSFNGEIYNDFELRKEITALTGYRFVTRCDAEVIPAGYLAWGESIFQRLEGMFAIALWDNEQQSLMLARDAAGIKPLYVSEFENSVRFGSEIKALLALSDQPRELAVSALHSFMAQGYVSPSQTLIASVVQIPPGTFRIYEKQTSREVQFWSPTRCSAINSQEQALGELEQCLRTVTNNMLLSDVPVGILQSGGIDSTLISYSLKGVSDLTAYTAQFDSVDHDESGSAAAIAEQCSFEHKKIHVHTGASDAETTFRKMVYHLDGQLADSSAFAVYKLMEGISKKSKVVLGGDGADEFFGGYPTYRATRIAAFVRPLLPSAMWRLLGKLFISRPLGQDKRITISEKIGRFAYGTGMQKGSQHAQWRRLLPAHLIEVVYGPAMQAVKNTNPLRAYAQAGGRHAHTSADSALLADQSFYLPADMLMKVDAMSMAHSVEVRVPFLDRRIMNFAGKLGIKLLTPIEGPDKKILRLLLARMGAPKFITSHPKRGFNIPVARMLREELRELCEKYLIQKADRLEPYFRPEGIAVLWNDHKTKKADHGYSLWALLVLALWLEKLNP
jgi:asparagine synthase (glutamine-hydrolysing)